MIDKLPTLNFLVKQLQQVPYLASKNLYRVANHLLSMDDEALALFLETIKKAHQQVIQCSVCCAWKEQSDPCVLCNNDRRDKSIICVVETWQELISIEKTGGYQGLFHVLGGVVCPLEGIGPEDLSIAKLLVRIKEPVKEVILATNQTPEGEATAAYIASKLQGMPVEVSCLARGVPVGSTLEFMDRLTVYKALSERRPF